MTGGTIGLLSLFSLSFQGRETDQPGGQKKDAARNGDRIWDIIEIPVMPFIEIDIRIPSQCGMAGFKAVVKTTPFAVCKK